MLELTPIRAYTNNILSLVLEFKEAVGLPTKPKSHFRD